MLSVCARALAIAIAAKALASHAICRCRFSFFIMSLRTIGIWWSRCQFIPLHGMPRARSRPSGANPRALAPEPADASRRRLTALTEEAGKITKTQASAPVPTFMTRKAAVIGSGGQLGVELVRELTRRGYQTAGWDRGQLDITDNGDRKSVV